MKFSERLQGNCEILSILHCFAQRSRWSIDQHDRLTLNCELAPALCWVLPGAIFAKHCTSHREGRCSLRAQRLPSCDEHARRAVPGTVYWAADRRQLPARRADESSVQTIGPFAWVYPKLVP